MIYFFIWPILQTRAEILQRNLVTNWLLFWRFEFKKSFWSFSIFDKTSRINILHIYIYILIFFPGFGVQKSIVQRTARETIWTRTNYFGEKLRKWVAIDDWPAEKASGKGRRTATCWLKGIFFLNISYFRFFKTLIIYLPHIDIRKKVMDIFCKWHFHIALKKSFGQNNFWISCTDSKVPFWQFFHSAKLGFLNPCMKFKKFFGQKPSFVAL